LPINPDPNLTGFQATKNAQSALKQGDKASARYWATLAITLSPDREEPWLLLAALANPHASLGYLNQALKVNPESPRALAGLAWARKRMEETQQTPKIVSSRPIKLLGSASQHAKTAPIAVSRPVPLQQKPASPPQVIKKTRAFALPVLVSLIILAAMFALAILSVSPVLAFFSSLPVGTPDRSGPAFAPAVLLPAATGTPVFLPAPAVETSPTPQASPTIEPSPTALPTDTGPAVEQSNLSAQELSQVYKGSKWILVDISEQHMYVYDGETLVYSFVASTGMNNGTRAGTFAVQSKIPNAYGSTWNIWMPSWLGIYYSGGLENGIHALPILSNGATLWDGYLGTPISYGCVVLGTYEAQLLYDWAEIGTPVIIQR